MSVRYVADLEQIESHVERARRFVDDLDRAVSHLDRVVDDLHVTWTGQAAEAHALAHREWVQAAHEMRAALEVMIAAGGRAHANYLAAATTNHDMWRALG